MNNDCTSSDRFTISANCLLECACSMLTSFDPLCFTFSTFISLFSFSWAGWSIIFRPYADETYFFDNANAGAICLQIFHVAENKKNKRAPHLAITCLLYWSCGMYSYLLQYYSSSSLLLCLLLCCSLPVLHLIALILVIVLELGGLCILTSTWSPLGPIPLVLLSLQLNSTITSKPLNPIVTLAVEPLISD